MAGIDHDRLNAQSEHTSERHALVAEEFVVQGSAGCGHKRTIRMQWAGSLCGGMCSQWFIRSESVRNIILVHQECGHGQKQDEKKSLAKARGLSGKFAPPLAQNDKIFFIDTFENSLSGLELAVSEEYGYHDLKQLYQFMNRKFNFNNTLV
jgi:hypothetical protein